jgi:hypothetical protein
VADRVLAMHEGRIEPQFSARFDGQPHRTARRQAA